MSAQTFSMGFASGDCDAANPVRQRHFFVSTQYKGDILDIYFIVLLQ